MPKGKGNESLFFYSLSFSVEARTRYSGAACWYRGSRVIARFGHYKTMRFTAGDAIVDRVSSSATSRCVSLRLSYGERDGSLVNYTHSRGESPSELARREAHESRRDRRLIKITINNAFLSILSHSHSPRLLLASADSFRNRSSPGRFDSRGRASFCGFSIFLDRAAHLGYFFVSLISFDARLREMFVASAGPSCLGFYE